MSDNKPKEYKELYKGIALMLISAALGCIGQMIWKAVMSAGGSPVYIIIGFGLYGLGAIAMIIALRYGPLSVLHPMNSAGYILSLFLGAFVLHEHVTPLRILGVIVIAFGLIVICRDGKVLIESPYDSNGKLKSTDKKSNAAGNTQSDAASSGADNAVASAACDTSAETDREAAE
jgi:undecaprenyl phosphate-alpha-L-ara4N flippase subunit ArnE